MIVACPVCRVAYGATRFLLDASGVDIIDAAAGKDWLKDLATDVWNSFD